MNTPPRTRPAQGQFGFLPSPPPLPRIAARAMACCALVQRAEIEPARDAEPAVLEATDDLIDVSLEWLARHGLADELAVAERDFLGARAGTLQPAARETHADAGEAAAVIAWALRRAPLPGFDVDADAAATAGALGWLADDGATLGSSALLRDREEIGAYLDAVSAVHWRLRERTRHDAPREDAPGDDAAALPDESVIGARVSMARWEPGRYAWPEGVTPLALADDGDMVLAGRTIAAATPLELLAALRRIRERHRATLWLLGQDRDWNAIRLNP